MHALCREGDGVELIEFACPDAAITSSSSGVSSPIGPFPAPVLQAPAPVPLPPSSSGQNAPASSGSGGDNASSSAEPGSSSERGSATWERACCHPGVMVGEDATVTR